MALAAVMATPTKENTLAPQQALEQADGRSAEVAAIMSRAYDTAKSLEETTARLAQDQISRAPTAGPICDQDLRPLLQQMVHLTGLVERIQGSSSQGAPPRPFPPPPVTEGRKPGFDQDDNHKSSPQHRENRDFPRGEDYTFMRDGKESESEMLRLVGRKRLDLQVRFSYSPEEEAKTADTFNVPQRTIYEHAIDLRMSENRVIAKYGLGEYSPTSPFHEYFTAMITVVNNRFVFLPATIDFLTMHRVVPVEFDVIWRCMMIFVACQFNNRPVNMESLVGELLREIDVNVLPQLRSDPRMMGLTRRFFERSIMDDVVAMPP